MFLFSYIKVVETKKHSMYQLSVSGLVTFPAKIILLVCLSTIIYANGLFARNTGGGDLYTKEEPKM